MPIVAHRLFFSLALIQAAISLLAWNAAPGFLGDAAWHVHEMVFGHAMGVVGGFLLARLSARALLAIAGAWILARAAYLLPGAPEALRAAFSLAATAAVALPAAQGFLRGAKRKASFVFPGLMIGFPLAELLFQAGKLAWLPSPWPGAWLGLGLTILLITAMGGRLVGAAASGAAQRSGGPRIAPSAGQERGLLALIATGFVIEASGQQGLLAAAAFAAAAALFTLRLAAWLPGLRRATGDVLAVAMGQAWLCVGLLARALAEAGLLAVPASAALHLATIGGIGGTTLVMAMRASAQRDARPMPARAALVVAGMVGLGALLRAFGPPEAFTTVALLWAVATLVAMRAVLARREGG